MKLKKVIIKGFQDGISTTWLLTKIIVPVYFFITFLKYTAVLDYIAKLFEPIMSIVGLPGEAALPIVLANVINIYPAIPAITALNFSTAEITIISVIILLCHSLPMELTLAKKAGANPIKIFALRSGSALTAGVILNIFL
jgi:hypothetical protein